MCDVHVYAPAPTGAPVHSEVSVVVPTPTEAVCDRVLVDEFLEFFRSPHLKERAAQLAFMSEVLFLRQPRRLQWALDIRAPRLVLASPRRIDGAYADGGRGGGGGGNGEMSFAAIGMGHMHVHDTYACTCTSYICR